VIDNVLTNLLPARLQDFFQVLKLTKAPHRILIIAEYLNAHAHFFSVFLFVSELQVLKALFYANFCKLS